jgi:hypothetical protein
VWEDKIYRLIVDWSRDHVYTLKALKYYIQDVKSGMEFYTERPREDGSFWDCVHSNPNEPAPSWFCEALGSNPYTGEPYFTYDENHEFTLRRIPVEADVEFCITEGVYYAWKASGDDDWMARQLPVLDAALEQNVTSPEHWSEKHGLRRRSFCMDSWDFANPHYCEGDHRCFSLNDPQFLFHGDNSGLYSIYWRLAEMHHAAGHDDRADTLRRQGEELRIRANEKLWFQNTYGHMIPEDLPEQEVYDLVGDERKRMSLSLGYTINRGLPTHEMAVRILREYQSRREAKKDESFAEWWTMDPPYDSKQWPSAGPPQGEYMNGGICSIVAGELAHAAFEHGMEDYAVDILQRTWALARRDGGDLHQVYRRIPEGYRDPQPCFQCLDLRPFANVGLADGARQDVTAWLGEGENDMRNLPTGRRKFGRIEFDVIKPEENAGRAVLRLDSTGREGPAEAVLPVQDRRARSLYFLHTLGSAPARSMPVATYDVIYADGSEQRIYVRNNHEIALWWDPANAGSGRRGRQTLDPGKARVAWRGPNGEWKNVGMQMFGWNNPRPDTPIRALRCTPVSATPPGSRGHADPTAAAGINVMLAGISLSDQTVSFEERIRSYGLPDCWSQAAVYYAIAEGLAGVKDTGRAFDEVKISPRWSATECKEAAITLHYPASDGYCRYEYKLDETAGRMTLQVTGSFQHADIHCLLPAETEAKTLTVAGREVPFENAKVEGSCYVDFHLDAPPAGPVVIEYN